MTISGRHRQPLGESNVRRPRNQAHRRFASTPAPKYPQPRHTCSGSAGTIASSAAAEEMTEATGPAILPAVGSIFGPKFDALRNAIYHVARRNYFDLLNRILNFLVIILGASVAGKAAKLLHVEESLLEF